MAHGLAAQPVLQLDSAAISCDGEPCRRKIGRVAERTDVRSREARRERSVTVRFAAVQRARVRRRPVPP